MNWLAVEETENNYSIRPQYLRSLSDICILSLASSLKCCSDGIQQDSVELLNDGLSHIIHYFKSNLRVSDLNQPVLPYWISDKLMPHILSDLNLPTEFFNRLFTNTFCSFTRFTSPQQNQAYLIEIFPQLFTFSLTSIDLFNSLVTDSIMQSLTCSRTAATLRILKLRSCTKFKRISSLLCFLNLTHLDISENTLEFSGMLPIGVLIVILRQFPHLISLDLHFTNFPELFTAPIDVSNLEKSYKFFIELITPTPALRELYLYTYTDHDHLDSNHLKPFYSALSRLTSLTHLDLSAWPVSDIVFKSELEGIINNKFIFLGLYYTPLTDWGLQLNTECSEISGFANGTQIISAMQRYSDILQYLDVLYVDLFNSLLNKHISLPSESVMTMAHLVLDSLDKYLLKHTRSHFFSPDFKDDIPSLLKWTACLYSVIAELRHNLTPFLTTRAMNTCVVFFNNINVADVEYQNFSVLTTNVCLVYCMLLHEGVSQNNNESMDYILCKFLIAVINISCNKPSLLISGDHFTRLLGQVLRILYRFLFRKERVQKGLIGTKLGCVSSLMRLIEMKLEEKKSDEHIRHASGALMNLTYLSLPNCMELSQKLHSDLLVRLIEEYSDDSRRDIVGLIMASVENIAEFCLQDEKSSVACQLLSPVLAVLSNPKRYNQDALACAIAVSAYYAVGAARWHWEETGEEALRLAEKAIGQIDYKVHRSQSLETLKFLVECLNARDTRVQLCSLWIICNLVYKQPDIYVKMLDEDSLETIRTIISACPQDSQHNLLGSEIIGICDITKKCAEYK